MSTTPTSAIFNLPTNKIVLSGFSQGCMMAINLGLISEEKFNCIVGFSGKVIDKKDTFRRIIDHKKNGGWIHISQLRPSKSFIIMEDKIMFQKNSKFSNPKVKLKKGRLVIVKKCIENWCKIKTDDYIGWVSNKNTWGY